MDESPADAADAPGCTGSYEDIYVDRAGELAKLRALADTGECDGRRFMLVTGGSGMGKTALMRELLTKCRGQVPIAYADLSILAEPLDVIDNFASQFREFTIKLENYDYSRASAARATNINIIGNTIHNASLRTYLNTAEELRVTTQVLRDRLLDDLNDSPSRTHLLLLDHYNAAGRPLQRWVLSLLPALLSRTKINAVIAGREAISIDPRCHMISHNVDLGQLSQDDVARWVRQAKVCWPVERIRWLFEGTAGAPGSIRDFLALSIANERRNGR